MTNEEYITRIVEQDEDFCIITDEVNGTVNIEVSLDWWKKQSNSDEDCISRAELLKAVDTWDKFGCDADSKLVPYKDCYVPYIHYDDVVKAIKGMPSVQPKTGHWIEHPEIETSTPEYLMFYECSECGDKQCFCKSDIHKKHFCNNCGAKMD